MDFKQLEAFACVVRLGSFSRAAERLFLTQPTISAHIKSLEQELGTPVLVRTPKAAQPTEKGKLLYDYALDMLSLRDQARAACGANDGGTLEGAIAVAASTVPCQHVLPRVTAAFRQQHPAVTFSLACCDSAGVVAEILAGKAEIGLTGTALQNPKLLYQDFMQDQLMVIAPPLPPYVHLGEDQLTVQNLRDAAFILREPGSGTRKEMESYLQKKGIPLTALQVVAQMDNPDAVKNAVAQGLGVSVMSRLACEEDARLGRLRMFSLEGEVMLRKLYLVRPKHRKISGAAEAFFTFVLNQGGL